VGGGGGEVGMRYSNPANPPPSASLTKSAQRANAAAAESALLSESMAEEAEMRSGVLQSMRLPMRASYASAKRSVADETTVYAAVSQSVQDGGVSDVASAVTSAVATEAAAAASPAKIWNGFFRGLHDPTERLRSVYGYGLGIRHPRIPFLFQWDNGRGIFISIYFYFYSVSILFIYLFFLTFFFLKKKKKKFAHFVFNFPFHVL
jgi:hypothetical protein